VPDVLKMSYRTVSISLSFIRGSSLYSATSSLFVIFKKQTKLDVPITLIEREQQALLENLKNRVSYELQISFEEYLKQAQKTEDQLKKGFEDIAKERVKGFLILHAIEKKENITVTKEEIDEKSKDKDQNLRYYIEDQLKKEKIFNILGC
jgi:FKBP-type peptidyl-prolyl cis-trans isomerase (trigger factor)